MIIDWIHISNGLHIDPITYSHHRHMPVVLSYMCSHSGPVGGRLVKSNSQSNGSSHKQPTSNHILRRPHCGFSVSLKDTAADLLSGTQTSNPLVLGKL